MVYCGDSRQPGKIAFSINAHESPVSALAMSAHAPGLLVTGASEQMVRVWDVQGTQPAFVAAHAVQDVVSKGGGVSVETEQLTLACSVPLFSCSLFAILSSSFSRQDGCVHPELLAGAAVHGGGGWPSQRHPRPRPREHRGRCVGACVVVAVEVDEDGDCADSEVGK